MTAYWLGWRISPRFNDLIQQGAPKKRHFTISLEKFLTIELFGQTYKFKADTGNTSAQEVADYLLEEVAKVTGRSSSQAPNTNKFAILLATALNIASEHVQLKRSHLELVEGISRRSANLMQTLDLAVKH